MPHRKYEQPIEDWMNQNDNAGMVEDLEKMKWRIRDWSRENYLYFPLGCGLFIQEINDFIFELETEMEMAQC